MRKLLLILVLFFASCSVMNESGLVLTKMYVGRYVDTHYPNEEKYCIITTTQGIYFINDTTFEVPDSALCYIRRETGGYDMHPDIRWHLEHQFFTWNGTTEEYRLKKNVDFRRLR